MSKVKIFEKQFNKHIQGMTMILLQYYNRTIGNNISEGEVVQRSGLGHQLRIRSVTL